MKPRPEISPWVLSPVSLAVWTAFAENGRHLLRQMTYSCPWNQLHLITCKNQHRGTVVKVWRVGSGEGGLSGRRS